METQTMPAPSPLDDQEPATQHHVTIDGNEAAASVAYRVSEVAAIYPITPSSPMGELADQWSSEGKPNIWGSVPRVVEMQSEGGAAGVLHGALQAGCLATTFTSSQGLLLMIPNMFKIAGELTPTVIHVAARTVATHALSIFGDHSDVMATRSTGFGMLASGSVQEVMDMAIIAHAAALESRVPFIHFFDGFRTSHEVAKVEELTDAELRVMINDNKVRSHRRRALSPDHPVMRGSAQNPDVFFQAREAANSYYLACPTIVQSAMDHFACVTGRQYHLFDYVGTPDAERVIVLMGSGGEAVQEAVEFLAGRGEKVGVLKVRLYRPFSIERLMAALPATTKTLAALDRTKEPGAAGDPLYLDLVTAINEGTVNGQSRFRAIPRVIGGRYGLSSKEFTPAMVKSIFDEMLQAVPLNHFTIGIHDDVTHDSLDFDSRFSTEDPETVRAIFYGLGSDGTVSANKNSIKIIGEDTDNYVQGYFVYDSKKSGAVTVSHLRFGPRPIHSTYLISQANFVACHQFTFLDHFDILKSAQPGAIFLLNAPYGPNEIWDHLPRSAQEHIIGKKLRFFVIDAAKVARDLGMSGRINTIMQTCFFAISGVLPRDEAIAAIKRSIQKTYGKRGEAVVQKNIAAVDQTLDRLAEVQVLKEVTSTFDVRSPVPEEAPEFVRDVTAMIIAGEGDRLPVSAMPPDGTFPTGTAKWEKRNIAPDIPVWDEAICIQCGKCVLVCPHAAIRAKVYDPALLAGAPSTFKAAPARWKDYKQFRYTLQVAPEDCTGCTLCVDACPVVSKTDAQHRAVNMVPQPPLREQERKNWDFFLQLPGPGGLRLSRSQVKDVQLLEPLFEFSGACSGCGETPYIKLLTQLFGDRTLIANATGCSSIFGGNLPTTPYTTNAEGRGPAWSNSLFEDNAEFGLGMRVALDQQSKYAKELLAQSSSTLSPELIQALLGADQSTPEGILAQRERVRSLKLMLEDDESEKARDLKVLADALVKKDVWIVGGDGWAYDIGYGGLDHVLASGLDVNILVLDTEVYSNTGGQMSKSTPRGAVAKFAAGGKSSAKKDLAVLAMTYGNVYVARVSLGGSDTQTIKAMLEAEAYPGPSLIIAYGNCIAHGYEMAVGMEHQKAAVQSGYWPLLRYNPLLLHEGKNPLQLDSRAPSVPLEKYMYSENRFNMLAKSDPDTAKNLLHLAQEDVWNRWRLYENWAAMKVNGEAKKQGG